MVNETFNCHRDFPYRLAPRPVLGVLFKNLATSIGHPVSSFENMQNKPNFLK